MTFRELLSREFPLSRVQLDHLERHYGLVRQWNRKINLTRIVSLEDVVRLHYCESLSLAQALPEGDLRIADIGSGAGFPGVPVAVLRPGYDVTLVESHKRKAVFLNEVAREVANLKVVPERAETLRTKYDWIVARAVRPEEVLSLINSNNFALLISEPELATLPRPTSVAKTPWGDNRLVAMFHVEHDRIDPKQ